MTVHTALLQGAALLEKAAVNAPRLTAEVLLAHALHCQRPWLYAHPEAEMPERAWIHYGRYLRERLDGKPTQYITCIQEFYGREFYVNKDVLIPRPETEHLVEAALAELRDRRRDLVVDVGTGSGAIAISVALESGRHVMASDVSEAALLIAQRNRDQLSAAVSFLACDLLGAFRHRSIHLLVSNPPYVPGADSANMQREVRDWEPHLALFAGDTGFEIYRRLIRGAEDVLVPGGRMVIELGYRSLDGVREMLSARWTDVEAGSDLAGLPRVISATLTSR